MPQTTTKNYLPKMPDSPDPLSIFNDYPTPPSIHDPATTPRRRKESRSSTTTDTSSSATPSCSSTSSCSSSTSSLFTATEYPQRRPRASTVESEAASQSQAEGSPSNTSSVSEQNDIRCSCACGCDKAKKGNEKTQLGLEGSEIGKQGQQVNSMNWFAFPGQSDRIGGARPDKERGASDGAGDDGSCHSERARREHRSRRYRHGHGCRCGYGSRYAPYHRCYRERQDGILSRSHRSSLASSSSRRSRETMQRIYDEALSDSLVVNFVTQNQNVFNDRVCTGHKGGWSVKRGL